MENWIHPPIIETRLFRDASDSSEWRVAFEAKPTGGAWSDTDKEYHLNEKLSAIFIAWNHLTLICKANIQKHFQTTQLL